MVWIFRIHGRPYLSDSIDSWEQMFLMQHYGFPTRLLDWTASLSVAAYFATRDINSEFGGAVWALAPMWLIYREIGQQADHLHAADSRLEDYKLRETRTDLDKFNKRLPLPIIPERFDERIIAQQGRFTIHTFKAGVLEAFGNEDYTKSGKTSFLQQIVIPPCAKPAMRQQVRMFAGTS